MAMPSSMIVLLPDVINCWPEKTEEGDSSVALMICWLKISSMEVCMLEKLPILREFPTKEMIPANFSPRGN